MTDGTKQQTDERLAYRAPEIVAVGDAVALTRAGGEKVVDAYAPDGHTANDWNIHNSQPAEEISLDVLK